MPNDVDLFQINAVRLMHRPAVIEILTYQSGVNAGLNFEVPFRYDAGDLPKATEVDFGMYTDSANRDAAVTKIDGKDGSDDNNWFDGGARNPLTAGISYGGTSGAFSQEPGWNTGSIAGAIPSNLAADTIYYGLVAIRQGNSTV